MIILLTDQPCVELLLARHIALESVIDCPSSWSLTVSSSADNFTVAVWNVWSADLTHMKNIQGNAFA